MWGQSWLVLGNAGRLAGGGRIPHGEGCDGLALALAENGQSHAHGRRKFHGRASEHKSTLTPHLSHKL